MTQKEFKQRLVLRYLGTWLDYVEEAEDVFESNEDGAFRCLDDDNKEVVKDAYDIAKCVVDELNRIDYNFFDEEKL